MTAAEAILDDPVRAALTGPHAQFARKLGRVMRYEPEVAPFMALPPDPTDEDWRDAAQLIGPGGLAGVTGDHALPAGWEAPFAYDALQMVGLRVTGQDELELLELGLADVPEMTALIVETEPGPFFPRTIELGRYLGIRDDGRLVALAGERMHVEGWTEISAVCTAPTHRGQGLASRLMRALVAGIDRRGERPFLHVLRSNTSAIRVYEELGFTTRRELAISVITVRGITG